MQPAKRDPRYTVQDVLAIIQNGESDLEMDDTDTSDEESGDDVCVDKDNQRPTDCPAILDIEPQANRSTMSRDRYCWQRKGFYQSQHWFLWCGRPKQDMSHRRWREDAADIAVQVIPIPNAESTIFTSVPQRPGTVSQTIIVHKCDFHCCWNQWWFITSWLRLLC